VEERHVDLDRPGGLLGKAPLERSMQGLAPDHQDLFHVQHGTSGAHGVLERRSRHAALSSSAKAR
jgi:hypothetical protein